MTNIREHVAYLLWCLDEGYLAKEDRESTPNWLGDDPETMHPDDVDRVPFLLEMADEILALTEEAVRADERERSQGVVVGVTGVIQDRGVVLGREEMLLELREKVESLIPSNNPEFLVVHEMFVAGYGAAIAAVLGLIDGSTESG